MGDANGSWPAGTDQPRRANKGLVAAIGTAVVVLAVVGGTAGWLLAGTDRNGTANPPGASATPSDSTTTEPPVVEPASESPGQATPTSPGFGGFALPDVSNEDFRQARQRLLALRLGVQLYFGLPGDDSKVERTIPAAGTTVRRGITIKVYVRGDAPMATVPGVVGLSCNQAGSIVVDHGLTPEYPSGRAGVVLQQNPEPPTNSVRWNDRVKLFCGTPSVRPSPSAGA